jgi:hypothetical protein
VNDPVTSMQQLATLRQQLEQSLAQVAANQRALEQQMQPQNLTDLEMLEQKLADAIEEVRARKANLQGQAPPSEPPKKP